MSIRRSLAAAVFVAAVSAPTVLGATQAMADTGPVGQSQPDLATPDADPSDDAPAPSTTPAATEAKAAFAAADESPAPTGDPTGTPTGDPTGTPTGDPTGTPTGDPTGTPTGTPTGDPTGTPTGDPTSDEEKKLRAELDDAIAEKGHSDEYYAAADAAKNGSLDDVRNFLNVLRPQIVAKEAAQKELDQKRAQLQKIIDDTDNSAAIRAEASRIQQGTDVAAMDQFLTEGYPAMVDAENRSAVRAILAAPGVGNHVRAAANAALAGSAADVVDFLENVDSYYEEDLRDLVKQALGNGGPEVRKAAQAALDQGDKYTLLAFLTSGLDAARALDAAANQYVDDGLGNPSIPQLPSNSKSELTDVALDDGVTADATELASTGTDAPIDGLTVGGATAILLGAGTLVVARRRQQS